MDNEKDKKTGLIMTILKPALLIISTVIFFTVKGSKKKKKLSDKE